MNQKSLLIYNLFFYNNKYKKFITLIYIYIDIMNNGLNEEHLEQMYIDAKRRYVMEKRKKQDDKYKKLYLQEKKKYLNSGYKGSVKAI